MALPTKKTAPSGDVSIKPPVAQFSRGYFEYNLILEYFGLNRCFYCAVVAFDSPLGWGGFKFKN